MTSDSSTGTLDRLLEAAFRQTLARFREQVERGDIDPVRQCAEFRRKRRDYATFLRMEMPPDEARSLAGDLLATHALDPGPAARKDFDLDVTRLLIRLYDAFIAHVDPPPDDGNLQGNR